MREIDVSLITDAVARLCVQANCFLPQDIRAAIRAAEVSEDGAVGREILGDIVKNYRIAEAESVPICQDTGMACVFLEIGQDVHVNGSIEDAVNKVYTSPIYEKLADARTGLYFQSPRYVLSYL